MDVCAYIASKPYNDPYRLIGYAGFGGPWLRTEASPRVRLYDTIATVEEDPLVPKRTGRVQRTQYFRGYR